ncbi:MAG: LegC family aminotransferase [Pseudomonadota bacterium]
MFDANDALERIRSTIGHDGTFVPLHEPRFVGREVDYVTECIETGWVSSVGAFVDRFEEDLARTFEMKHAVAVVNGTAALHLALILAGVTRDDEVLVPALTFIASANAIAYCGAVPHFCDSEEATLGLDAAALATHLEDIAELREGNAVNRETGRTIRAVIPMHCFGHPCEMDALVAVCTRWNIAIIEDAAEAVGSRKNGRPIGHHGRMATLSFNGNKIMTTGGGGAILTNDPELAKRAKYLSTTAKRPHPYEFHHDEVGYNYRLPNINAALGVAQLETLPDFLSAKRALAKRYQTAFADFAGGKIFTDQSDVESNYWLVALILEEGDVATRDTFLKLSNDAGVMTRPIWTLMQRLPMYTHCPRMPLPVAESLEARIINVPSSVRHGVEAT